MKHVTGSIDKLKIWIKDELDWMNHSVDTLDAGVTVPAPVFRAICDRLGVESLVTPVGMSVQELRTLTGVEHGTDAGN